MVHKGLWRWIVLASFVALGNAAAQSTVTPLEQAQLAIVKLTDELRQEKLKSAACGGQLQEIFAQTYGADSKKGIDAWIAACEASHPGFTCDAKTGALSAKPQAQP